MKAVIYDAGVLVAAEKNDRRTWAEHRVRLETGILPLVPCTVLAQVSRSPKQVQMHRLLRGCEVVAFDEPSAHRSGALLARARTMDVGDASVVALAIARSADIVTSDSKDIRRLATAAGRSVSIFDA